MASRLDAFSAYPNRTRLLGSTLGSITDTPEVRPTRSSRTKVRTPQFSTPATDRDRTVSRRSEPSSRATFNRRTAEPLGTFQPQDGRADIEVPNRRVDMSSWRRSACYPRSTFYPLSDGQSTQNHRITIPCFRTWSTCKSHSQAPLCYCTLRTVTIRAEGTLGSLRYAFGGDHPSQTTHQTVSPIKG